MAGRQRQNVSTLKGHRTKAEKEIREQQEELMKDLPKDKIKAPVWLSTRGKKIFNDIKKNIESTSLLCNIDVYGLAIVANEMDRYIEAQLHIQATGSTVLEPQKNGTTKEVKSVHLQIQKDSLEGFSKLEHRYGLDPASRQKIIEINTEVLDEEAQEYKKKYSHI